MENARNVGHVSWSFHHRFVQKYLRYALLHIFNVGSCHCKTYSAQSENKLNFRHTPITSMSNLGLGLIFQSWHGCTCSSQCQYPPTILSGNTWMTAVWTILIWKNYTNYIFPSLSQTSSTHRYRRFTNSFPSLTVSSYSS